MKIGRYLLLGVVLLVGTTAAVRHWKTPRPPVTAAGRVVLPTYDDSAYDTRAPDSVRVKVEVVNATKTRGLARRATAYLRDRGFDVVAISTTRELRKETLVLDRSGHPGWAKLLAKAMRARMESRPDTSRYLDATVLLGSDWAPPALPFYP